MPAPLKLTTTARRCCVALLIACVFPAVAAAEDVAVKLLPPAIIEERLHQAAKQNGEREAALVRQFLDAGCERGLVEQPVKHSKLPNVICTLPGATDSVILVGAHYDHVSVGDGVVDNWSGAALLASLLETLSAQPRRHTFVFVGFTDEEAGLVGSEFYVKNLSQEQKKKVAAMVCMDSLGLAPTEVWVSRSDRVLVNAIGATAASLKLPVSAVNVERVGTTDSAPFRAAKIPVITVHSVTDDTLKILHSKADSFAAMKLNDYYDTYRLLSVYLAYLDGVLGKTPPVPPAPNK